MSGLVRHRATMLVAAAFVAALVLSAWLGDRGPAYDQPLDPENPPPAGAQAVAEVLGDRGVDGAVARSAAELDAVDPGPDSVVLVTGSDALGPTTVRRMNAVADGSWIIVVAPGPITVRTLGQRDSPVHVDVPSPHPADCANLMLTGLSIEVDAAVAYDERTASCFGTEEGALFVNVTDRLAFLGAGEILANDQILRADNAAAALRLLGQRDRLVWYVPDLADLAPSEQATVAALLPRWLRPALWIGLFTAVALVVWRARRLGPLVVEPLPVAVKAIETTHSRGRLYRKVNDREHAAAALRSAARDRLADRLRLPRGGDEVPLVRDLARHLGRSAEEMRFLIGSDALPPPTDHDLVELANRLAALDEEIRHA